MGYYFCMIDSNELEKNKKYVKEHYQDLDLEKFIVDDLFWDNSGFGYPFSASFTKYLIDCYGLDAFKKFGNSSDLSKSCQTVYGKSLKQIIEEWQAETFR